MQLNWAGSWFNLQSVDIIPDSLEIVINVENSPAQVYQISNTGKAETKV